MVSIKCQSQYNARLLAGCSLARSVGTGERRPGPPSPGRLVLSPVSAPGAEGQPERPGVARSQRPQGPDGRSRYKDYIFAGSPVWG